MIITTGWGILVPVLAVVFPLLTRYATVSLTGSHEYYESHTYIFYYALIAATLVCYYIGRHFNAKYSEGGENDTPGGFFKSLRKHTVFFLPMEQVAFLIPVIGYLVKSKWGIF